MSKMAISRHLGFYRTANSTIRSADPENHCLEPNMEWFGCTIQYTRVTDGRTELVWHIRTIAYMLSCVKTMKILQNALLMLSMPLAGSSVKWLFLILAALSAIYTADVGVGGVYWPLGIISLEESCCQRFAYALM